TSRNRLQDLADRARRGDMAAAGELQSRLERRLDPIVRRALGRRTDGSGVARQIRLAASTLSLPGPPPEPRSLIQRLGERIGLVIANSLRRQSVRLSLRTDSMSN